MTNFFPHETIRGGQDQLVKDIETALQEQKILLAHAPTGLGKTASVLSVAIPYALENKKKILFLTNRHTQHQIAIETLKLIKQKTREQVICADLIGKKWMCNQDVAGLFGNEFNEYCKLIVEKGECPFYSRARDKKNLTVEAKLKLHELMAKSPQHCEEVIALGKAAEMCSYELSLGLAKEALVLIGDYYYAFNPFVQNTLFNKLELKMEEVVLIVDEGHNLPNRIVEMASSALTSNMIKNAIIEAKKFKYGGVISWLSELMRILNVLAEFETGKEELITRTEFMQRVGNVVDYDVLIDELEMAAEEIRKKQRKSYLGGIAAFLAAWKCEDEGFARIISEKDGRQGSMIVLQHVCLDPALITKKIFDQIYAGVVMSGTLKPTFMYKDVLGIERGVEKEYGSPFPPENKLTLIVPETTTKYTSRSEGMYQKIAEKCSELSGLIPGNVALFFPSYDLRDRVAHFIKSNKERFWEKSEMTKEEKEDFLNRFRAVKDKGGLLLGVTGANFAEGIDLPGDFLNGVVVIGLPLSKPDLKTQEIIKYLDQKYSKGWDYGYLYPAINKCLQSAGRCIRSETDKGVVIYLDERFAWQNYFICFPKEGLIVSKEYEKLLKGFFGNHNKPLVE